jgi:predicted DNA-binding transcriptional regulator AlpA
MADAPLMTRKEAAAYLGVSVSWLAQGNGPPVIRLGKKLVRYAKADIDAYIASGKDTAKRQEEEQRRTVAQVRALARELARKRKLREAIPERPKRRNI